jgi:hypothetical protein
LELSDITLILGGLSFAASEIVAFAAAVILDELDASGSERPRLLSSLSLLLCHPKAETAHLVIINELNSGLFERCLDPDQCRNIAGNWLMTFFYALNRGRPHTGGLR